MTDQRKSEGRADPMTAEGFAESFDVSRETLSRLMAYQALLGKWQAAVNLVGPATLQAFWGRHAADSAQLLAHAPARADIWLDLGSGAGFPGLVMAIILAEKNPAACVHMVESDRKKANFLRAVLADTGVAAEVHQTRIEALADTPPPALQRVDVVTARALAALPDLLRLLYPFCNSSTVALLHKGRQWQEELTAAQQYWTMQTDNHTSLTDAAARILALSDLRPVA